VGDLKASNAALIFLMDYLDLVTDNYFTNANNYLTFTY